MFRAAWLCVLWCAATSALAAQAQLVVEDGAGEGLNDPTPVAPVGGNDGQTLGEQRRIALRYAASILASRIDSRVPIRIAARFNPLACSRNSATLARTAPTTFVANFSGAAKAHVRYPVALANAQHGARVAGIDHDINARFNASLDAGRSDCLGGTRWYYGLDGARPHGTTGFVSTAVHELIHGLGFISLVAVQNENRSDIGQFPPVAGNGRRLPDIFSTFIADLSLDGQPRWPQLTDAERARSLTHGPDVVWGGANTNSRAASLLNDGLNRGRVELYAPGPISPGSSISHWDTSLDPDQIMEPFATGDDVVIRGIGLSACVLEDIGWTLINGTRCPDVDASAIAGGGPAVAYASDAGQPLADPSASSGNDDSGGGSGGGCTLAPQARFDPLWLALLGLATLTLAIRRRSRPA